MKNLRVILVALSLIVLQGTVFAGEELFDTKEAAALSEKGISHLKTKDYDAAVNELEESLSIAPEAETYYYLGYAYYMKGKSGDAESRKKSIENFDKAYELDPGFSPNKFKAANGVAPNPPASAASKQSPDTESQKATETSSSQPPVQPEAGAPQTSPDSKAGAPVKNISNVPASPR